MTVLITLSGVSSNAGPLFDLYLSPNGITFTVFASGINKTVLVGGYQATVPNGTTHIKVTSVGACTNSNVATIGVITTTTSTTSTTSTTTTTTTELTTTEPITTEPLPPCTQWLAIVSAGGGYVDIINCSGEAVRVGVPFNPQNPQRQTPFCSTSIVGTSGNVGLTNNGVCP